VGKVKIPPLLRDFQAEGKSPAFGLSHEAAFSTAHLPTNSAKEPDLKTAFAAYGPVGAVTVVKDKATGVPRGFAFVEMSDDKAAQEAILGLNGSMLAGKAITVNEAHAKTNNAGSAPRR
jgi:RNA recognition motif-containing protein